MASAPPPGYTSPFNASAVGIAFWFLMATTLFYGLLVWIVYPFLYDAPLAYFIDLEQRWRRSLYGASLDVWIRTYGDALYDLAVVRTGMETVLIDYSLARPAIGLDPIDPSTMRFLSKMIDNTLDWLLLIAFRVVMIFAWSPLGILMTTALTMDSLYTLKKRLYEFGDGSVVSSVWARRALNSIPPMAFLVLTMPLPVPALVWPILWLSLMIVVTVFVRNTPKRL